MPILLLLWTLTAGQEPGPEDQKPERADVELAAIRQIWWPKLHGIRRVDGEFTAGTTLRLVDDLRLPDTATIPMYGGGDILVSVNQTLWEGTVLLFSAEYWTHGWSGSRTLASAETLGDEVFPAGSPVESRFHLMSLLLDAFITHEEKPFSIGASIPLQVLSSRFRMDAPGLSAQETIREVCWGLGVFAEFRPVSWIFTGVSAKGLTGFRRVGKSRLGDLKGYLGFQAGPLALEGGYRYAVTRLEQPGQELDYVLFGPYASVSLTLRF
jgi:hypothetical protein